MTHLDPPKVLLTIAEQIEAHKGAMKLSTFAGIVGCSYDASYDWVTRCGCPATKVNGTYWLDPALAARWWREHSTPAVVTKPRPTGRVRPPKTAPARAVLAAPPKTRAAAGSRA
jgi:hypothetical protein